jgi:hypothetical protein
MISFVSVIHKAQAIRMDYFIVSSHSKWQQLFLARLLFLPYFFQHIHHSIEKGCVHFKTEVVVCGKSQAERMSINSMGKQHQQRQWILLHTFIKTTVEKERKQSECQISVSTAAAAKG